MSANKLQTWLKVLLGLHDGREMECPNCGGHNLDYGYVKTSRKGNTGFGAVWCKDCHHAFHASRVELTDEHKMISELPTGLIFS
ncbi:MAG: hypothetical protein IIZ54_02325 [Selenomonadaceae bacterium]|nr:hypothetical protein [Selenomonadaceae bacterium]